MLANNLMLIQIEIEYGMNGGVYGVRHTAVSTANNATSASREPDKMKRVAHIIANKCHQFDVCGSFFSIGGFCIQQIAQRMPFSSAGFAFSPNPFALQQDLTSTRYCRPIDAEAQVRHNEGRAGLVLRAVKILPQSTANKIRTQ